MKVVGIDPGLKNTGIGIVSINKNNNTRSKWRILSFCEGDLSSRILNYYKNLKSFLKKEQPDIAVMESLFYGKNTKTLIHLGELRGAYILLLKEMKIPFFEFTPREVKISITGNGGATKDEVKYIVKKILKIKRDLKEDESDALATALCYILRKND